MQTLTFDPTGWFLSEKIDGFRATWNGCDFISTNGNTFAVPAFFKTGLPDKPLVGELFIGGRGGFEQLQSTVKSGEGWGQVRFAIFDVPGEQFPQRLAVSIAGRYAYVLPQTRCESAEHLAAFYEDILATGGEGVMLRCGSVLTKIKPRDDDEAVVVGYNASAQDHGIASLTVRNAHGTFRVAGLGFAVRFNPPMIGEVVTYLYSGFTRTGLPKHPKLKCVRLVETFREIAA